MERVVRAALDLVTAVAQLGDEAGAGWRRGPVVTGEGGGDAGGLSGGDGGGDAAEELPARGSRWWSRAEALMHAVTERAAGAVARVC